MSRLGSSCDYGALTRDTGRLRAAELNFLEAVHSPYTLEQDPLAVYWLLDQLLLVFQPHFVVIGVRELRGVALQGVGRNGFLSTDRLVDEICDNPPAISNLERSHECDLWTEIVHRRLLAGARKCSVIKNDARTDSSIALDLSPSLAEALSPQIQKAQSWAQEKRSLQRKALTRNLSRQERRQITRLQTNLHDFGNAKVKVGNEYDLNWRSLCRCRAEFVDLRSVLLIPVRAKGRLLLFEFYLPLELPAVSGGYVPFIHALSEMLSRSSRYITIDSSLSLLYPRGEKERWQLDQLKDKEDTNFIKTLQEFDRTGHRLGLRLPIQTMYIQFVESTGDDSAWYWYPIAPDKKKRVFGTLSRELGLTRSKEQRDRFEQAWAYLESHFRQTKDVGIMPVSRWTRTTEIVPFWRDDPRIVLYPADPDTEKIEDVETVLWREDVGMHHLFQIPLIINQTLLGILMICHDFGGRQVNHEKWHWDWEEYHRKLVTAVAVVREYAVRLRTAFVRDYFARCTASDYAVNTIHPAYAFLPDMYLVRRNQSTGRIYFRKDADTVDEPRWKPMEEVVVKCFRYARKKGFVAERGVVECNEELRRQGFESKQVRAIQVIYPGRSTDQKSAGLFETAFVAFWQMPQEQIAPEVLEHIQNLAAAVGRTEEREYHIRHASVLSVLHKVCHEISDPMVSIRVCLQHLKENSRLRDVALSDAERINEFMEDLELFERRQEIESTTFDLRELVYELKDCVERYVRESPRFEDLHNRILSTRGRLHGFMSLNGFTDTRRQVHCPRARLAVVVKNLFLNALEYNLWEANHVVKVTLRHRGAARILEVKNVSRKPIDETLFDAPEYYLSSESDIGIGYLLIGELTEACGYRLRCTSTPTRDSNFSIVVGLQIPARKR